MLAGAAEMIRLMRATNLRPHGRWAMFTVALFMLTPWLSAGQVLPTGAINLEGLEWHTACFMVAALGALLLELRRGAQSDAMQSVGATLLVMLYCGFLPSFVVMLRCDDQLPLPQGAWLVLLFLAVTKVSDIGAYFGGRAFGLHKLMPSVSPGKTVEGAVAGIASSASIGLLLWCFSRSEAIASASDAGGGSEVAFVLSEVLATFASLSLAQILVFSGLMSVMGQLGDLVESVLKRAADAKDSATLIPSFGGVLDIVDSPVMAAPVAWFLLTCLWAVV
jgi:phosphatidate cytidylyltransferase